MFQSTNKKSLTTVKPLIRDYLDLTFCHLQELGPYWVTFLPQLLGQILPHVKIKYLSTEKLTCLLQPRNAAIMNINILFSKKVVTYRRLKGNEQKLQTFGSKSAQGRCCLREVVACKRYHWIWWIDLIWYFGKLVTEKWLLMRDGCNWRFDCIINFTVVLVKWKTKLTQLIMSTRTLSTYTSYFVHVTSLSQQNKLWTDKAAAVKVKENLKTSYM